MNVLVLGSGARESAILWKLSKSKQIQELYAAPGNDGMKSWSEIVNLDSRNFAAIKDFIVEKDIKMLVVGQEQPLVEGIIDYFNADTCFRDLIIIGPCKKGAELEGSKDFAKAFMFKNGIPTASYKTFTKDTISEGKSYLKTLEAPYVLKADGLASGKGVVILQSITEAEKMLEEMLCDAKFGKASSKVVIEEFLQGIEVSVFVLTDGNDYCILPEAKDYKRIGDGDTGLNTGGMGSVSPVPFFTEELRAKVEKKIIIPTLEGLKKEGIIYRGFLFIGLMIKESNPYVIEYNVRMGDPETQSVIPRIENDLFDLFRRAGTDNLSGCVIKVKQQTAVTVVVSAENYPQNPILGNTISIPNNIPEDVIVFPAGVGNNSKGEMVSTGGRVLSITAIGKDIEDARKKAYDVQSSIEMIGKYSRTDIGKDLI